MLDIDALLVKYFTRPEDNKFFDIAMSWFLDHMPHISIHDNNTKNIGLTKARNILIDQSKADVLILSDFDLLFGNMDIQAMTEMAMQPDVGMVMPYHKGWNLVSPSEWQPMEKCRCHFMVIRRQLLLDIGKLDERYFVAYADWDLLNRLEMQKLKILQHNKSEIRWHYHLSSRLPEKSMIWDKDRAAYDKQWSGKRWNRNPL